MTMKLINYNVCDVCEKEVENITHLFLLCSELVEFHLFMQQKLSVLFDNVDSDKIDNLVYEEVFMFGLFGSIKGVNNMPYMERFSKDILHLMVDSPSSFRHYTCNGKIFHQLKCSINYPSDGKNTINYPSDENYAIRFPSNNFHQPFPSIDGKLFQYSIN
ncbi:unnamed protein product [Mytilus edulis]|uniref:Reverse transcriptase zinc-binding domain-containing protein n=1 Tax=Mytilus edulis TaxID=6550 RepID=A0A8S3VEX3_MYTED|nr:unnamed protein product [Mytilus edulis]